MNAQQLRKLAGDAGFDLQIPGEILAPWIEGTDITEEIAKTGAAGSVRRARGKEPGRSAVRRARDFGDSSRHIRGSSQLRLLPRGDDSWQA